ncbi:MAG: heat-inducible transcriptional repressor HrcA [Cypionkella sp.]
MTQPSNTLADMSDRTREVFRRVVEGYLDTGDPVGSRTLTRSMSERLSAATIRNVMQDLEYLGLLNSPHISAGRIPTERGLRIFVDGLLDVGDVGAEDRQKMESAVTTGARDVSTMLDHISTTLSGLTRGASIVLAPKQESVLRQIEFVSLSAERALAVLVFADGHVENRVFAPPAGISPSSMREAANFLNALVEGRTLSELRHAVERQMTLHRQEIDGLARGLVESGLALWENSGEASERLIVRGRANLIDDHVDTARDIDRIRELFDDLERKRDIADFLSLTEEGEGVRIFIGSENKLFSLSGSTLVVSPYVNADRKIIGAVGVIGPTRLNYGRIVPIVDYTAQLMGRLLSDRGTG